jgi:hypothetical protein
MIEKDARQNFGHGNDAGSAIENADPLPQVELVLFLPAQQTTEQAAHRI